MILDYQIMAGKKVEKVEHGLDGQDIVQHLLCSDYYIELSGVAITSWMLAAAASFSCILNN